MSNAQRFDFDSFSPDRSVLFDLVRARVDDAMLRIIANADYGAGFDEYYAGLRAAMQTGEFGGADLKWGWPALSIALFSDYFETPERRRVGRLFLASAILRSEGDGGRIYDENSDETLIVVEHAASFGGAYVEAAIRSLAWCGTRSGSADEGRVLMSLAILALWPYATNAVEKLRRPTTALVSRVQAWAEPLLEDHLSRFGSVGWQAVFRASGERVRELATARIIDRETATRYRRLVERIEEFRE